MFAPNEICDDFWLSWPAIHRRAITHGTVVVFDVFASVGNLFLTLNILIKVCINYVVSNSIPPYLPGFVMQRTKLLPGMVLVTPSFSLLGIPISFFMRDVR